MKKYIFWTMLGLLSMNLNAQFYPTQGIWSASGTDNFSRILSVNENRLLLVGETNSIGNGMYIGQATMVDTAGQVIWANAIGDLADDRILDAVMSADSGFFLLGYTNSAGQGAVDVTLSRIDKNGALQWSKTIGGTGNEYAKQIELLPSGDLVLLYSTTSFGAGSLDFAISRVSSAGTILWTKTWGGTGGEGPNAMTVAANGDLIVVGSTNSFGQGQDDVFAMRMTSNGTNIWYRVYGSSDFEFGSKVVEAPDGMIYIAGAQHNSDYDVMLMKLTPLGDLLHASVLTWSEQNFPSALHVTPDHRVFMGAQLHNPFTQSRDYALIEFDTTCNAMWANLFGSTGDDYFRDMMYLGEGAAFAMVGFSNSYNIDNDGLWFRSDVAGTSNCNMTQYGLVTSQAANYIEGTSVVQVASPILTSSNWLATTSPMTWNDSTICIFVGNDPVLTQTPMTFHPNPVQDQLTVRWTGMQGDAVKLQVLDLQGRILLQQAVTIGQFETQLATHTLPNGVYVLEWQAGEKSARKKIEVLR